MMDAKDYVKYHEGLKLKLYTDIHGHQTIGFGHNFDESVISMPVATQLFDDDYFRVLSKLDYLSWFGDLPATRRQCIIDMTYNMGINGLLNFEHMILAIKDNDFDLAAEEILNSQYGKELPLRAHDNAELMRTGVWIDSDSYHKTKDFIAQLREKK